MSHPVSDAASSTCTTTTAELTCALLQRCDDWFAREGEHSPSQADSPDVSATFSVESCKSASLSSTLDCSKDVEAIELFEGCEKRLILCFVPAKCSDSLSADCADLRKLSRDTWSRLLEYAKCSILSSKRNEHFVAYLLSESSLFVYERKIMIKTCGTTTVLEFIPAMLAMCATLGLTPSMASYSHTNYMFPEKQPEMYRDFGKEVAYLNRFFDGEAIILGPVTGARWNIFAAGDGSAALALKGQQFVDAELCMGEGILPEFDCAEVTADLVVTEHAALAKSPSFELVMFDLDPDAMSWFIRDNLPPSLREIECVAEREAAILDYVLGGSGLLSLLPGDAIIDAFQFEPCGFSLNALRGNDYWTMHITPEAEGSFVSFECTNMVGSIDFLESARAALALLKPTRFGFCATSFEKFDGLAFSTQLCKISMDYEVAHCTAHASPDSMVSVSGNMVRKRVRNETQHAPSVGLSDEICSLDDSSLSCEDAVSPVYSSVGTASIDDFSLVSLDS